MEREIQKIENNPLNPSNKNNKEKMDNISENEIERALSFSKNKMIDIEETIEKCKEKDGIELLNFICSVMKERKRNILESLYKELGKDYLIANLEKTLNIENNGGLIKGKSIYEKKVNDNKANDDNSSKVDINNEKKTIGGIFFSLIKKDPEAKAILTKAVKLDMKETKQRKKVYKLMDKLNI